MNLFFIAGIFCYIYDFNLRKSVNHKVYSTASEHIYFSLPWNKIMNKPQKRGKDKYPEKRKITPKTVRIVVNEYYVPHFSDLLNKGLDCIEWIDGFDDPYLNKYKLDLRVEPKDGILELLWKESF